MCHAVSPIEFEPERVVLGPPDYAAVMRWSPATEAVRLISASSGDPGIHVELHVEDRTLLIKSIKRNSVFPSSAFRLTVQYERGNVTSKCILEGSVIE